MEDSNQVFDVLSHWSWSDFCRSLLAEEEFHRLADTTLECLQERLEEYGDSIQLDGFDINYGNQVLTLKLGSLGTYVINKQTPNRQIWLSSPVSLGMSSLLIGKLLKRRSNTNGYTATAINSHLPLIGEVSCIALVL